MYGTDKGAYLRKDKDGLTNATRKTKFTKNRNERDSSLSN
jgi:hypothetical protein